MSKDEESVTRVYTINLGRAWLTPAHKRTDRVVNMVRAFAEKHMKTDEVKLDQDLNRQIWTRGKTNPPRKLRVKMVKDEDEVVTVSLYEEAPETSSSPVAGREEKKTEAEKKTVESTPSSEENKDAAGPKA